MMAQDVGVMSQNLGMMAQHLGDHGAGHGVMTEASVPPHPAPVRGAPARLRGRPLAEPMALLVATHLALCVRCRRAAKALEALGGALLNELEPTPLAADGLERVHARLEHDNGQDVAPAPGAAAGGEPDLPEPLRVTSAARSPSCRGGGWGPIRRSAAAPTTRGYHAPPVGPRRGGVAGAYPSGSRGDAGPARRIDDGAGIIAR